MISIITPTHNPQHLRAAMRTVLDQTYEAWEWVIVVNGNATVAEVRRHLVGKTRLDPRIRIMRGNVIAQSIGAIKGEAFRLGRGDILVELDHDDMLTIDALDEIHKAFVDKSIDFVYSNYSDVVDEDFKLFHFYPDWRRHGWRYRTSTVIANATSMPVAECVSFKPSAATMSLIYTAPNHVRAWRKSFYHELGGHDPSMAIADDHELLIRTYLRGRMHHIDKCLYLYRMGKQNTFSGMIPEIERTTYRLHAENIEALVLREAGERGLTCIDLGGAFACPPGWVSVDLHQAQIVADLRKPWPFADSSIMAFRAHDIIEHLPDKQHTMSELHRCLVPGGHALISVPSTDGRGAFQDPTHVSYWNENSFWYWTRSNIAAYIHNRDQMFIPRRLLTHFPSGWHRENNIPYTVAELIAFKGDMTEIPGFRP